MCQSHMVRGAAVAVALAWTVPAAQALVETIDATVTAEIQEFENGSPTASDFSFEDLVQTTGNLPLMVDAGLFRTVDGEDQAGATARTAFFDPRLSIAPDPDEFSIDAGTFSRLPGVFYQASSSSTETRRVVFLTEEIGQPAETELQVRSQFFVDGILLVWGESGQSDLTGTTAQMVLRVLQTRPGAASPIAVLNASVMLVGQADGTVTLSTTGAIAPENVAVMDLSNDEGDLGPIHMVVIPAITALPYVYSANVDERFTLEAEIEGEAYSQFNTGAAVQLGVPLLELETLIGDLTAGAADSLFQQILQHALTSSSAVASKPLLPSAENTTITVVRKASALEAIGALGLCGSVGVESGLLLTLFAGAVAFSGRRRR